MYAATAAAVRCSDRVRAANVFFHVIYFLYFCARSTSGGGLRLAVTVAAVAEDAPGETGLSSGPAVKQTHPIREQLSCARDTTV